MPAEFGEPNGESVDRRRSYPDFSPGGQDRRQFGANYDDLSPAGREFGLAIDRYKVEHHRRFITPEELLAVAVKLGYQHDSAAAETTPTFTDRRSRGEDSPVGSERRQFAGNYRDLSPAGQQLSDAIDQYKLRHRRRVINPDELVAILQAAGYRQAVVAAAT
ncbi:MAG: hypothetical protein WD875_12195 [Pirellulales bacterium]